MSYHHSISLSFTSVSQLTCFICAFTFLSVSECCVWYLCVGMFCEEFVKDSLNRYNVIEQVFMDSHLKEKIYHYLKDDAVAHFSTK